MRLRTLRSLLPLLVVVPFATLPAQGSSKSAAPDPKAIVPPPKMWAAQVSPTEFNLVWGRVPAATAYEVLVRNAQGQLVRIGTAAANATRYIVPTAALQRLGVPVSEIQFAIQVVVGRVAGELGLFNPVSLAKQGTAKALVAPTNAVARETSPGVITVTWDEVPGATAYAIGRVTGGSGLQRFCDICPTGGILVDTVPTAGTTYSYGITAILPGGRSRVTRTDAVEVTRLATDAGGTVVATADTATMYNLKGLADGASITVRPLAGAVVQVAVNFAMRQGGVTAEVVRRVCNGPLQVIRTIGDLVPFNFDDRLGGLDFPECNATTKVAAEYFVRLHDPKGAVVQSKAAVADVATVAAADTAAGSGEGAAVDSKGLAAGITVTPRVGSGGMTGSILRLIVRVSNSLASAVGAQVRTGMVGQLMRQACDGPWILVREVALDVPLVDLDDAVTGIDTQCGTGKRTIRYQVRVASSKGLAADSKLGIVEVEAPATVTVTEPPATPGNRRVARMSDGSRTLTWDTVATAEWYRIERVAGAKGAWTVVRELPGTATSWKDTAVPGGDVRYRITAVNRAGNSATGNFP